MPSLMKMGKKAAEHKLAEAKKAAQKKADDSGATAGMAEKKKMAE